MPYPDSQHPDTYGWPAHGVGPYEDYYFHGYKFASGVAAGTAPIWDAVGQLILDNGTQLAPDPAPPLTQANVENWNFWGQEDRQSRNSNLWSIHSWGLACDYNSAYNPNRSDSPPAGPYRLPSNMQQLLDDKFGPGALLFGGDWGDWMHVEIHMSPSEVAAWIAANPAGGSTKPVTPVTPTVPTTPTSTEDEEIMGAKDEILAAITAARNNDQNEIRAEVRASRSLLMQDNRAQIKALGASLASAIAAGGTPQTIAAAVEKALTDNLAALDADIQKD